MTETELVKRSKNLYERILDTPFSPDEMLAFGRAVYAKTPWGALTPEGKLAVFRLAASLARPGDKSDGAVELGAVPHEELVGNTAEQHAGGTSSGSGGEDADDKAPSSAPHERDDE